jgi:hypothetical protein
MPDLAVAPIAAVMRRRAVAVVAGLTLLLPFSISRPAYAANVYQPAGCNISPLNGWESGGGSPGGPQWGLCIVGIGRVEKAKTVLAIQRLSNYYGCSAGTNDGVFGSATLSGVKCMQTRGWLTVDGVVGPETWSYYGHRVNWDFYCTHRLSRYYCAGDNIMEEDWGQNWSYVLDKANSLYVRMDTTNP